MLLLIFSCNSDDSVNETEYLAYSDNFNTDEILSNRNNGYLKFSVNSKNSNENADYSNRKLIKNGNLTFETNDLSKTKIRINQLVLKHGGYLSRDSQNELDNRQNIHLNIRVPAKKFDSLIIDISKGVEKFDYRQIKIKDVTEEFVDLESRLKNKKELEKRYLEILKKAKNVKEILEVEREVGKLREDIESAEGRMKFLKDQISFSTLEVSFYKVVSNESSFSKKFKNAFKDGYKSVKSFLLFIVSTWPFIIIGIILVLLLRRRLKRRKN